MSIARINAKREHFWDKLRHKRGSSPTSTDNIVSKFRAVRKYSHKSYELVTHVIRHFKRDCDILHSAAAEFLHLRNLRRMGIVETVTKNLPNVPCQGR